MTERFMKVETAPGEYVAPLGYPSGRYILTTSDGIESSGVNMTLEQFRSLLAPFPELREAPKP
jgi:hypothetical protein